MVTAPRTAGPTVPAAYRALVRSRVAAQASYRASFAVDIATQMFVGVVEFVEIYVIFHQVDALGGFSFAEVALMYGLATAAFGLADGAVGHHRPAAVLRAHRPVRRLPAAPPVGSRPAAHQRLLAAPGRPDDDRAGGAHDRADHRGRRLDAGSHRAARHHPDRGGGRVQLGLRRHLGDRLLAGRGDGVRQRLHLRRQLRVQLPLQHLRQRDAAAVHVRHPGRVRRLPAGPRAARPRRPGRPAGLAVLVRAAGRGGRRPPSRAWSGGPDSGSTSERAHDGRLRAGPAPRVRRTPESRPAAPHQGRRRGRRRGVVQHRARRLRRLHRRRTARASRRPSRCSPASSSRRRGRCGSAASTRCGSAPRWPAGSVSSSGSAASCGGTCRCASRSGCSPRSTGWRRRPGSRASTSASRCSRWSRSSTPRCASCRSGSGCAARSRRRCCTHPSCSCSTSRPSVST